jgi:hypothetical protein
MSDCPPAVRWALPAIKKAPSHTNNVFLLKMLLGLEPRGVICNIGPSGSIPIPILTPTPKGSVANPAIVSGWSFVCLTNNTA